MDGTFRRFDEKYDDRSSFTEPQLSFPMISYLSVDINFQVRCEEEAMWV